MYFSSYFFVLSSIIISQLKLVQVPVGPIVHLHISIKQQLTSKSIFFFLWFFFLSEDKDVVIECSNRAMADFCSGTSCFLSCVFQNDCLA